VGDGHRTAVPNGRSVRTARRHDPLQHDGALARGGWRDQGATIVEAMRKEALTTAELEVAPGVAPEFVMAGDQVNADDNRAVATELVMAGARLRPNREREASNSTASAAWVVRARSTTRVLASTRRTTRTTRRTTRTTQR